MFRFRFRQFKHFNYLMSHGATAPRGPGRPHYQGFTITLRHTTLGRTPLHEWSARRRDLYLTTHNTHNREIFVAPAGFEPVIPATERPQTHALDRAATGIGNYLTQTTYSWKVTAVYLWRNTATNTFCRQTFLTHMTYFSLITDVEDLR
jgi:hypothetical protein